MSTKRKVPKKRKHTFVSFKAPQIKKESIQTFFSQKQSSDFVKLRSTQGIIISVATVILILILQKRLPPEVPLFYGLPKGEYQLTSALNLTLPSLISLAIIGLNYALSIFMEDDFIQKALVFVSLVAVFFSTITTIKIFLLVGNI